MKPVNRVRPKKLLEGDTVGIFAPSEPLDTTRRERVKKGAERLKSLGFKVHFGQAVFESYYYMAGTLEQRVKDLHEMLMNPSVTMILTAWGGRSANQLIDHIDYEIVAQNPKIISGFSDSTNIVNAIFSKVGLVTFHGPNVLGKIDQAPPIDIEYFKKALMSGDIGQIPTPDGAEVYRHGNAEGILVGGNLSCFTLGLIGTPYQPDFYQSILFWETGSRTSQEIDQYLTHLRLCGVFEKISGMVVGYITEGTLDSRWGDRPVKDVVLEVTAPYCFPVVYLPIFGHGKTPNITLPIGCRARLETNPVALTILEPCVS